MAVMRPLLARNKNIFLLLVSFVGTFFLLCVGLIETYLIDPFTNKRYQNSEIKAKNAFIAAGMYFVLFVFSLFQEILYSNKKTVSF